MSVPVFASLALLRGDAPQSSVPSMLFMYAAIFAIFYFVLLRPQQKQKRLHQDMVGSLKKGDEVVTGGGIVGEVVHIAQQQKDGAAVAGAEDRITIKSGESRMIIERKSISRVVNSTATAS